MANKTLLSIVIIALLIGSAGFYFYGNNSQSSEEKISVIKIGSTAPGHLKFLLNMEKGWLDEEFAKDGIKIEYYPFTGGGSEAMVALASGGLDFTYTGTDPALRTAAAGADIKMIGLSSFGNPVSASSIIVRNDSAIKSVKDLKGKKVAYLKGTVRHATITKALKNEGLSINDIESFNLDFAASGPALIRGDVDAIVESESTTFPLVSKGDAKILFSGKDHPGFQSPPSPINVRGDFARKHPDIVKRLLKIDLKTSQWADEHFDETMEIFARVRKQNETATRNAYSASNKTVFNDPRITDDAIQALKDEEEFMKENNLMEGKVDYNSWIDKSFLEAAIAELNKK